ncbi:MAG: methyltransferase domain-containing protein [Ilumatobacteraceae bacterium]|nr:MAG: methyltransferase domain-containing protein [Actinomycetota bacterium]
MATSDTRSPVPSIAGYLEQLNRWRFPPEGDLRGAPDQSYRGWRRVVVRAMPDAMLQRARVLVTRTAMLAQRRTLRPTDGELRLHLGCGECRIPGWVNIDLAGGQADLVWDLRRPLPVEAGSATAIFHEHFLEHLPLSDALDFLRECHDMLAPGGVLRIGVPDFREHFRSYIERDTFLDDIRPGRPAPLFALNELVYSYGHASLWDMSTFRLVLEEVGFEHVEERAFGESRVRPAPDSPERRNGTLYVEAVKPGAAPPPSST